MWDACKTKFYPQMVPLGSEPHTQQHWIDTRMLLGEFALEGGLSKCFFSTDLDTFFFLCLFLGICVISLWTLGLNLVRAKPQAFFSLNKQMQDGNSRAKVHLVLGSLACVTNNHLHGFAGSSEPGMTMSNWSSDHPWFRIFRINKPS